MSKIGNLLGKSKKVKIEEVELEIFPLKVKDMMKFGDKDVTKLSTEEQMKLNRDTIKNSMPNEEITDIEIDNMSTKAYTKLLEEIMQLNGFGENESTKGIKEKITEFRAKQGSNNSS